jgi:DNA-binding CsgD family transcriptional regulator
LLLTEIPNSNDLNEANSGIWEISPFIVFGLCGFTLYLTWMFMVFASPVLAPENIAQNMGMTAKDPLSHLGRLIQLIALLACLLVAWRVSDRLSHRQGIVMMLVASLILSSLGLLVLLFGGNPFAGNLPGGNPLAEDSLIEHPSTGDPSVFTSGLIPLLPPLIALLLGVSQGFMILLWSVFVCVIGEHRVLLFVALCVGCAAALALLLSLLLPMAAVWITLLLPWLSLSCFASIHFRLTEPPKPLLVYAKASDKRFKIHIKSSISVIYYSMAIGFATCFIVSFASGLFGVAAVGVAVIVASAIVAIDSTHFHRVTESLLAKLHMPAMIIGVAPLFFTDRTFQILGCTLLLCFFMIIYIVNLTALAEHVRIYHLNPIRVFGFGRAKNAFGFLLGGFLCYLAFSAPWLNLFGSSSESAWTNAVLLCLLGIFGIGSSFIFEDHYPLSKSSKLPKPRPVEKEHQLPSGNLRTLSAYMLMQDEDSQSAGHGIWSRRIKALSLEHGLSPKETEVLFLLAKGRNAEYIQNELVVSRHTAKAHIYHIYQKTGVHSRQDLINLLENVDIDYE